MLTAEILVRSLNLDHETLRETSRDRHVAVHCGTARETAVRGIKNVVLSVWRHVWPGCHRCQVLLLSSCHMLVPHFTPPITFSRDVQLSTCYGRLRQATAGSPEYCACRFAKLLRSLHTDPSNLVLRKSLVVPKQSCY